MPSETAASRTSDWDFRRHGRLPREFPAWSFGQHVDLVADTTNGHRRVDSLAQ